MVQEREVARAGGLQRPDRLDRPVRIPFDPAADQLGELGQPVRHASRYLPGRGGAVEPLDDLRW